MIKSFDNTVSELIELGLVDVRLQHGVACLYLTDQGNVVADELNYSPADNGEQLTEEDEVQLHLFLKNIWIDF